MEKKLLAEFMVTAHRGAKGHAPENTLPSFEQAIECKANMIEFDVRLTMDGHMVLMHDATVDRTTNGTDFVSQLTLKQIKKLDAGAWFSPKFKNTKVPTLEEAIASIKGKAKFDIEVKHDPSSTNKGLEERLIDAILKNNILDHTVVISFDLSCVKRIKEIEPRLTVGFLFSQSYDFERGLREILAIGGEEIHPEYVRLTAHSVSKAHRNGIRVRAWTPNDKEEMSKLIKMGVDGIKTGFPDLLRPLVKSSSR